VTADVPLVLFLCVHNAARSQMAMGWFNHFAGDRAVARSGGSEPAAEVNPAAATRVRSSPEQRVRTLLACLDVPTG
jgi:protein-tyrosine-phosphatase